MGHSSDHDSFLPPLPVKKVKKPPPRPQPTIEQRQAFLLRRMPLVALKAKLNYLTKNSDTWLLSLAVTVSSISSQFQWACPIAQMFNDWTFPCLRAEDTQCIAKDCESTKKWLSSIDLEIAIKRSIRKRSGLRSSSSSDWWVLRGHCSN